MDRFAEQRQLLVILDGAGDGAVLHAPAIVHGDITQHMDEAARLDLGRLPRVRQGRAFAEVGKDEDEGKHDTTAWFER